MSRARRLARWALPLIPGFLVGLAFGLAKIVRDCSLTCNVGFEYAPLAVLAVALATLAVADLRARFEGRLGFARWQIGTVLVSAVSFLAFRGATLFAVEAGPGAARWIYLAFFVWLGVVGAVLGPNVKALIYRVTPPSRQPRVLAWSAASVMVGGLVGSVATARAVPLVMDAFSLRYEHARDWLMVGVGLVLLAWVPVIAVAARGAPDPAKAEGPRLDLLVALRQILREPRYRRLAALVGVSGVAEAIVVYLFYWVITDQTSAVGGRTVFFADFYAWMHAGTLAVLVLGANRAVDRVGLFLALASLPFALFVGTVVFLVHTVVLVMYGLRIAEAALEESVYELGVERALLGVGAAEAPLLRPILQGAVGKAGRGVGAILVLVVATGFHVEMRTLIVLYLGVLLAWVGAAISLRRFVAPPAASG